METPQNETNIPQEQEKEKKRSPWLVVIIILLIIMMCCCLMGVVLCRGGAMLPDFLNQYLQEIPGFETGDNDFWGLVEEFTENPEGFFPDGVLPPDLEEYNPDLYSIEPGICKDLSGNFEMKILVGPSDAVGLEPFGVGSIPFTVKFDQGEYIVQGDGTIDYEDVLEFVGGTFTVFFDMDGKIDGVCTQDDNGGVMDITFKMTGKQVFIVDSAFHEEYPKSFDYEFDYSYPVVDGATESGEGWALILHLD